jgi:anti-sigma B factor antagonist
MPRMATPPEEFSIAESDRDGRAHLTLRGELDLATAPELENLVNERLDAGREVVVDLRGLEFMDSSGIRVLVAGHARAARTGARLFVVRPGADSAVAKIIEVSGLDGELNIVDDPANAG